MKTIGNILMVFTIMVFSSSCEKKVLPEDVIESPVFYTEGTIGGSPLDLAAGPSNVVVTSNYMETFSGLPIYNSTFYNAACEDCSARLSFNIVGDVSMSDDFESKLPLGDYTVVPFVDVVSSTNSTLDLILMMDPSFFASMFNSIGEEIIPVDGVYQGLEDDLYFFNVTSSGLPCSFDVSYIFPIYNGDVCFGLPQISIADGFFSFSGENYNADDALFIAEINNVSMPVLPNMNFLISDFIGGESITNVSLTVGSITNQDSCFVQADWTFFSPVSECSPDVSLFAEPPLEWNIPQSVSVEYVNEMGAVYHSVVNMMDSFDILNAEAYEDDPQGREAYKLKIASQVMMVNTLDATDEIYLNISEGYIPVVNE